MVDKATDPDAEIFDMVEILEIKAKNDYKTAMTNEFK